MSSQRAFDVAVVGATGVVGREMLRVLAQRDFPAARVRALATERSAGKKLPYNGHELTIEAIGPEAFDGVQLALFSAGTNGETPPRPSSP